MESSLFQVAIFRFCAKDTDRNNFHAISVFGHMSRHFFFAILLSLTFSVVSHAKIGTKREVIEAAKAGEEPAYITPLMQALSTKLNQFVDARGGLKSPRKKAAFLITMRIFNDIAGVGAYSGFKLAKKYQILFKADEGVLNAGLLAAVDACSNLVPYTADVYHCYTKCSVYKDHYMDKDAPWMIIQKKVRDAASRAAGLALFEQISIAALEQHKVSHSEGKRIAYRVAEWSSLNYLLKRADRILPEIYGVVVERLPKYLSTYSIFYSPEAWDKFQSERFGRLPPQTMVFLNPWLQVLR